MSGLIWIQTVLKKPSILRVKYGILIKCEGIIKAIFENPKADQNTLSVESQPQNPELRNNPENFHQRDYVSTSYIRGVQWLSDRTLDLKLRGCWFQTRILE